MMESGLRSGICSERIVLIIFNFLLHNLVILEHLRVEHVERLSDVDHPHPLLLINQVLLLQNVPQPLVDIQVSKLVHVPFAVQVDQVTVNDELDLANPSFVYVDDGSRLEIDLLVESVLLVADRVALVHVLREVVQIISRFSEHVFEGQRVEFFENILAFDSNLLLGFAAK